MISLLTITRVSEETFPDFFSLICSLARYERLPLPDEDARMRLRVDILGCSPKCEGYIGWLSGRPVGYVTFYLTYSTFLARSTLYLEDIFVLREFRGRGYGRSLFLFCRKEAVSRNCGRMDWMVLSWNEDAIRFYEHIGATRLLWYPYRLEGESLKELGTGKDGS